MSWNLVKQCLGWIIDTCAQTITLPQHRIHDLSTILASVPLHQTRISKKKWYHILGKFRSVSLALPGSRGLFSFMQEALLNTNMKHRLYLKKSVHEALQDFRWLLNDIASRPTRIAEIVPLAPSALGYHDASGTGAGGIWFPTPELAARVGTIPSQPISMQSLSKECSSKVRR